jgi:lambda family phage portal protein
MKKQLKQSIIERAIAQISPQWALKRHQARTAMALTGGYSGAGYHERMTYWQPGTGDSDWDTIRDLKELRARSRDLVRNSPIASGAIETQVTHVVGSGLSLQSKIDAERLGMEDEEASEWQSNTERLFTMWAESEFADAFDQQNFYELQDLAFRSRLESGDSFVVLAGVNRPDWPFTIALQIIEADRISNPNLAGDTEQMTAGIEKNASGQPIAVHIADRHPGRGIPTSKMKWQRIAIYGNSGRRNVIHLMRKLRPGQTRGVPELAPIIEQLKQLSRYSEAEVDAAVNSAVFALFAKMDPDTFTDVFDDTAQQAVLDSAKRWDGTIKSGAVVNLLPGESIENPVQNRPNPNFDPFVSAVMRQIGIGLNIPYEVLSKHFQSSYSAARAALLDAWRTFRVRREWLAAKLCQPVYEEWLADAVATGLVAAPGFFADPMIRKAWSGAKWNGDGPGSIDPEKEARAARERMDIGLTTLAEEIVGYDGGDWETKHRQQVEEKEARIEGGLIAPVTMTSPGAAAPMMPENDSDDTDMKHSTAKPYGNINFGVHLPQGLELNIPAPIVNVHPTPVTVEVAPPVVNVAAPEITVEAVMPEQKAPIVITSPQEPTKNKPYEFDIVRGKGGKIVGIAEKGNPNNRVLNIVRDKDGKILEIHRK